MLLLCNREPCSLKLGEPLLQTSHLAEESHVEGGGSGSLVARMLALHLGSLQLFVSVPQQLVALPPLLREDGERVRGEGERREGV